MKLAHLLPVVLLITATTGCKRYSMGKPFLDPPPPALAQDWQVIKRNDLGFTIALPPGAQVMDLPGKGTGAAAGDAGLQGLLGSARGESEGAGFTAIITSADSPFGGPVTDLLQKDLGATPAQPPPSTATTVRAPSQPYTGKMAMIIMAEQEGGDSYEALATEIESRMKDIAPELKVEKKKVTLAVGEAMCVRGDMYDSTSSQNVSLFVYTLGDGKKTYFGLFMSVGGVGKEVGFSPDEIMSTFRARY